MKKVVDFFKDSPVNLLLIAIPLALMGEFLHWGWLYVFIFSALGIIPLAGLIGTATEGLAEYTGPRIGGLLNATLGNAAELIITIVAIREGLLELVLASITGSILGNILLVMGLSMVVGGLKHGIQRFDSRHASRSAILLMLAVIAMLVPSALSSAIGPETSMRVEALSLGVAAIMIFLYAAGLFYSFRGEQQAVGHAISPASVGKAAQSKPAAATAHNSAEARTENPLTENIAHSTSHGGQHWTLRGAIIALALATLGVVFMSELLVGVIEPVVTGLGVSEFFLGVILIPLIGNVAEHLVAVKVAAQNHMELSVEIAVASSLQIALFVAPVLVFVSLLFGQRLHLVFNEFELLALIVGVLITVLISEDGESNWLEGAELLAVYFILALAFFLLPV